MEGADTLEFFRYLYLTGQCAGPSCEKQGEKDVIESFSVGRHARVRFRSRVFHTIPGHREMSGLSESQLVTHTTCDAGCG